jgi:hypothetical protein
VEQLVAVQRGEARDAPGFVGADGDRDVRVRELCCPSSTNDLTRERVLVLREDVAQRGDSACFVHGDQDLEVLTAGGPELHGRRAGPTICCAGGLVRRAPAGTLRRWDGDAFGRPRSS